MIKINLVPAEILAKAQQRQQTVQVLAVAAALAVVVLGVSAVHILKAQRLETQLAADKDEMKKWQAKLDRLNDLEKERADVKARIKVISDLRTGRPLYPYFMSDFIKAVPASVWVHGVQTASLPNLSLKLTISAESRSGQDIVDWIKAMTDTGKFSGMEIGPVSISAGPDGKTFTFTMTATYASKL